MHGDLCVLSAVVDFIDEREAEAKIGHTVFLVNLPFLCLLQEHSNDATQPSNGCFGVNQITNSEFFILQDL